MSHWKGYETKDIFSNEDHNVDHLPPSQDGEEVLKSVTFNDSHKKLRCEAANDGRTSVYHEGSMTETALAKLGARLPSYLKEGSSNILDRSLSLISEKDAPSVGIQKCSAEGAILDCKGDKISTISVGEGENDTGNNTLCSDYGNRGDTHNKKVCVSSVDTFVGILTTVQMSGEDDLLFSNYPNISHFEDFEKMFRNHGSTFAHGSTVSEDEISWFSSSSHGFHGVEDTLQSVVLSSVSASSTFNNASSAHDLCTDNLPATERSAISTEFPSSTDCSSFPLYSDAERKGKSLLSELAYDSTGVEKSLRLDQIGYGNDHKNPIMIDTTLKELSTTKGKQINPSYGATVRSSLSSCGLTHSDQDQELLSSFMAAPKPCSCHVISKKTLVPEALASNCLQCYNSQAQLSDMLKSSIIKSSDFPANNPSSDVIHSMGLLPGPFPILPKPTKKNKEIYACPHFPTAWVMDKPLEQLMDNALERHAEASDPLTQKKYKFEDEFEGDKEPAVSIGFSTLQDNSGMTSTFIDDASIKATNFQQLQMIMDQLGIRTRLCIRDSLYRLARSAEQSHCYGSANNVCGATSPMRGFQDSKDSKRPPEFLGLSTNEIERAVAYLLFHKSLESGTGTADDTMWLRTSMNILDPVGGYKGPYQPST